MVKGNTLAIALGALLVGGVATAGFINNNDRGSTNPMAVDGAYRAADDAANGLAYADVVSVEPVIEREERYATVIGTDPVRESSTTTTPQQVCEDVAIQERMPERDGNVGGTVAGALIGGLVGNQVGGGNGRKAATAAGAVAGGFIGNRVDRNHVGGQVVDTSTGAAARSTTHRPPRAPWPGTWPTGTRMARPARCRRTGNPASRSRWARTTAPLPTTSATCWMATSAACAWRNRRASACPCSMARW